jgi:hypothetical protein
MVIGIRDGRYVWVTQLADGKVGQAVFFERFPFLGFDPYIISTAHSQLELTRESPAYLASRAAA